MSSPSPTNDLQRVHYFSNERLLAGDFQREQDFLVFLNRVRNRGLFTSGIVSGLEVRAMGAATILVTQGQAFDGEGRTLVLAEDRALTTGSLAPGLYYLTISYEETPAQPTSETGVTGHKRMAVVPRLSTTTHHSHPALEILLAIFVQSPKGTLADIQKGKRRLFGFRGGSLTLKGAQGDTTIALSGTDGLKIAGSTIFDGSLSVNRLVVGVTSDTAALTVSAGNGTELALFSDSRKRPVFEIESGGTVSLVPLSLPHQKGFVLNIDDRGKVGIGTSQPRTQLQVIGTISARTFYGKGSGLEGLTGIWSQVTGSGNGTKIFYDHGNVGIGTEQPNARLEVIGYQPILGPGVISTVEETLHKKIVFGYHTDFNKSLRQGDILTVGTYPGDFSSAQHATVEQIPAPGFADSLVVSQPFDPPLTDTVYHILKPIALFAQTQAKEPAMIVIPKPKPSMGGQPGSGPKEPGLVGINLNRPQYSLDINGDLAVDHLMLDDLVVDRLTVNVEMLVGVGAFPMILTSLGQITCGELTVGENITGSAAVNTTGSNGSQISQSLSIAGSTFFLGNSLTCPAAHIPTALLEGPSLTARTVAMVSPTQKVEAGLWYQAETDGFLLGEINGTVILVKGEIDWRVPIYGYEEENLTQRGFLRKLICPPINPQGVVPVRITRHFSLAVPKDFYFWVETKTPQAQLTWRGFGGTPPKACKPFPVKPSDDLEGQDDGVRILQTLHHIQNGFPGEIESLLSGLRTYLLQNQSGYLAARLLEKAWKIRGSAPVSGIDNTPPTLRQEILTHLSRAVTPWLEREFLERLDGIYSRFPDGLGGLVRRWVEHDQKMLAALPKVTILLPGEKSKVMALGRFLKTLSNDHLERMLLRFSADPDRPVHDLVTASLDRFAHELSHILTGQFGRHSNDHRIGFALMLTLLRAGREKGRRGGSS